MIGFEQVPAASVGTPVDIIGCGDAFGAGFLTHFLEHGDHVAAARFANVVAALNTTFIGSLTPEKMANLRPGEAFIWSSKATDEAFTKGAVKIRCRPRVTHHGGATKTAV